MARCRHCRDLWRRQAEPDAYAIHPECLAIHDGAASSIVPGSGPVTSFGWLDVNGPPVAFARGPVPLAGGTGVLDATATDLDRGMAGTKAIAELLERQTAYLRPRAPVRLQMDSDTEGARWSVQARSLVDGEGVLIPAERFVLASQTSSSGPGSGDSTGIAVGPGSRAAVVAGLLESVERAGVAAMYRGAPTWRVPTAHLTGPFVGALNRQGWWIDVVGCEYIGFAVAVCVASHVEFRRSIGGAAARSDVSAAVEAAAAEAYMKSIAFPDSGRVIAAATGLLGTEEIWPDLPGPATAQAPTADPLEIVRRSGRDAAVVDRGNPLIDAIGWRAAHVVLLDEPTTSGSFLEGLLR